MKLIKAQAIPEFNSQVLDTIINTHGLPLQDKEEFTISDLRSRGWTRDMARTYVDREIYRGNVTKRMGRSRMTNRTCWLYREKKK